MTNDRILIFTGGLLAGAALCAVIAIPIAGSRASEAGREAEAMHARLVKALEDQRDLQLLLKEQMASNRKLVEALEARNRAQAPAIPATAAAAAEDATIKAIEERTRQLELLKQQMDQALREQQVESIKIQADLTASLRDLERAVARIPEGAKDREILVGQIAELRRLLAPAAAATAGQVPR